MQWIVWSMFFCRSASSGETKPWCVREAAEVEAVDEGPLLEPLQVAALSSLSICLCRISTPSKPMRAASSMHCSMESFESSLNRQKE